MYISYFDLVGSVCPEKDLRGVNFQKVCEDGTPEGMHFPSEFWITAIFGSGSCSLQTLEILETSVPNRKKLSTLFSFIFLNLKTNILK